MSKYGTFKFEDFSKTFKDLLYFQKLLKNPKNPGYKAEACFRPVNLWLQHSAMVQKIGQVSNKPPISKLRTTTVYKTGHMHMLLGITNTTVCYTSS